MTAQRRRSAVTSAAACPVAARTIRQERRSCPDCGCGMQLVGRALRCPWTTATRYRFDGDAIACDWPYDRRGVAV